MKEWFSIQEIVGMQGLPSSDRGIMKKAEREQWHKENGGKIEVVRTTDIHKPHLVGASAGYLISKCISA